MQSGMGTPAAGHEFPSSGSSDFVVLLPMFVLPKRPDPCHEENCSNQEAAGVKGFSDENVHTIL